MLSQEEFPARRPQVMPVMKRCKGGDAYLECVGVDKWQKTSILPGMLSVMAWQAGIVLSSW